MKLNKTHCPLNRYYRKFCKYERRSSAFLLLCMVFIRWSMRYRLFERFFWKCQRQPRYGRTYKPVDFFPRKSEISSHFARSQGIGIYFRRDYKWQGFTTAKVNSTFFFFFLSETIKTFIRAYRDKDLSFVLSKLLIIDIFWFSFHNYVSIHEWIMCDRKITWRIITMTVISWRFMLVWD